jgi:hypothetical protein
LGLSGNDRREWQGRHLGKEFRKIAFFVLLEGDMVVYELNVTTDYGAGRIGL